MKDATSQLRSATRRAKSDVANKLVSMFLHELSRRLSQTLPMKVDSEDYGSLVRSFFDNRCPYCCCELTGMTCIIEHLDGMNRYRVGLHLPGNVLVACRKCNGEKRRDDAMKSLTLANSGWESFLLHDGSRCGDSCATCRYWKVVWPDDPERRTRLSENRERIQRFRSKFPELGASTPLLAEELPGALAKLYSDCQAFAQSEIQELLQQLEHLYTRKN